MKKENNSSFWAMDFSVEVYFTHDNDARQGYHRFKIIRDNGTQEEGIISKDEFRYMDAEAIERFGLPAYKNYARIFHEMCR